MGSIHFNVWEILYILLVNCQKYFLKFCSYRRVCDDLNLTDELLMDFNGDTFAIKYKQRSFCPMIFSAPNLAESCRVAQSQKIWVE